MNHTTQTILGVLVVIGIAMGALFFFERSKKEETLEQVNAPKEYRNSDHGFSLTYPATLDILEYTDDMAGIGTLIEGGIASVVDVRVAIIQGEPGESFMEAAARNLSDLCAADGPGSSFTCTGVDRTAPFVSTSGAIGLEVYLTGELKTLDTGAVQTVQKGPFYVFLIQGDASVSKVLIVHAPLNQNRDESDAETIKNVAASVKITEGTAVSPDIEQYVSDNISSLSPEPEVLGGTYYVTSIAAADGKGVVSYEDGHNAYTADFTYSIAAGVVSIDSFAIQQ